MELVDEFTEVEREKIAAEFLRLKAVNYLDNAGTALYAENQIKKVEYVLTGNFFCNPHTSRSTENIIDQVRYR